MANNYIQAKDFFLSLKPDDRVFWLIRHGTRRHITEGDAHKGALVGLTDDGRAEAFALGKLFPKSGDAVYFSSPVGRCIETAEQIAAGRETAGGPSASKVNVMDSLGHYFVRDYDEYLKQLNSHFYQNICNWMYGKDHPAFFPIGPKAEELVQMMFEKGTARFNIFSTHDAWVVPCLGYFCNFEFSPSHWMNYLTGMAIVVSNNGDKRIVPVTGLSTGNLDF